MKKKPRHGFLGKFFPAGIQPVCPKCGHQGFIVLRHDAVVNADKPLAMVTCSSQGCHAVIGVLPGVAVWEE